MSLIELKNVCKIFGKSEASTKALEDINLNINRGEMVALVGRSGCGKSTLLNILGGLDTPTEGEYIFDTTNISILNPNKLAAFRRNHIGFIVQDFALISDMSSFENIALPLKYRKIDSGILTDAVDSLLKSMDIFEKKDAFPSELSGGQCQRVAIARALACNPDVLLADEPTGALDENNGEIIIDIFKQINNKGVTIIMATHDKAIANECKRIIELKDGHIV